MRILPTLMIRVLRGSANTLNQIVSLEIIMTKKEKQRKHEAEYHARTRVQFNTIELHNLLHGYRKSLSPMVVQNSLTVKLEQALNRCKQQANQVITSSE
jgi:hypothetical protein